ncbi:MAG: hypothetical protein ACRDG3_14030, partial [Tepidiformaceae bacterium]
LNTTQAAPCRLDDSLTVTLLDSAGDTLAVVGNPAVVPIHMDAYSGIVTIPLKWENWCGAGGVTVRAVLGSTVTEHAVASPPECGAAARLSWLSAGTP